MNFSDFNLSKCPDGLLPVIVQDAATLRVLMLGYMNEEAFRRTQAESRVTHLPPRHHLVLRHACPPGLCPRTRATGGAPPR